VTITGNMVHVLTKAPTEVSGGPPNSVEARRLDLRVATLFGNGSAKGAMRRGPKPRKCRPITRPSSFLAERRHSTGHSRFARILAAARASHAETRYGVSSTFPTFFRS
jgi:hypothetical protein